LIQTDNPDLYCQRPTATLPINPLSLENYFDDLVKSSSYNAHKILHCSAVQRTPQKRALVTVDVKIFFTSQFLALEYGIHQLRGGGGVKFGRWAEMHWIIKDFFL